MPKFTTAALKWLNIILEERFGHTFTLEQGQSGLKLSLNNVSLGYILFPKLEEAFHLSRSDFPCSHWDADRAGWISVLGEALPAPCVSELPEPLIEEKNGCFVINYDILGLTYWMLNRIEEIGRNDLDSHDRFPATASHAYKNGYLERPVVDEWLHILGQVIQRTWPALELKKPQYSIKVSHDVDRPSRYGFHDTKGLIRAIGSDLLKYKNINTIWQAPYVWLTNKNYLSNQDPYNTFDWIMKKSEESGLISAFYFICGGSAKVDANYEINSKVIMNLIRDIRLRGHEVGLHPSYECYLNKNKIENELNSLYKVVSLTNPINDKRILTGSIGGRMHYLRFKYPDTLQNLSLAGVKYDSSLGYAEHIGFRCGTSHSYLPFNPIKDETMNIIVVPLIVMDMTLITYMNMNLNEPSSMKRILRLNDICKLVGGNFTILWHNSALVTPSLKSFYSSLIENL